MRNLDVRLSDRTCMEWEYCRAVQFLLLMGITSPVAVCWLCQIRGGHVRAGGLVDRHQILNDVDACYRYGCLARQAC